MCSVLVSSEEDSGDVTNECHRSFKNQNKISNDGNKSEYLHCLHCFPWKHQNKYTKIYKLSLLLISCRCIIYSFYTCTRVSTNQGLTYSSSWCLQIYGKPKRTWSQRIIISFKRKRLNRKRTLNRIKWMQSLEAVNFERCLTVTENLITICKFSEDVKIT